MTATGSHEKTTAAGAAPSARPLILLAAPSLLALVGTHVCVFLDEDGGEEKTVRGEEVNSHVKKKLQGLQICDLGSEIWETLGDELFFHLSYLLPSC